MTIPYENPLRGVSGLMAERVDMGADFGGTGPIYAPAPGIITEADHAWAGAVGAPYPGTWIEEEITAGPLRHMRVYFAEDIDNIAVQAGQRVTTRTRLGDMAGGIETGFAAGPTGGQTLAAAAGQASTSGDPGRNTTAYGRAWADWLNYLGTPPNPDGGPRTGSLPAGFPMPPGGRFGSLDWNPIHWITNGVAGAATGALSGITSRLLTDVEHFAIVVPVVIAAAGLGVLGLYLMTKGPREAVQERTEQRAGEAAQLAAVAA